MPADHSFSRGDRVRVREDYPPGHMRTPVYVRGKEGVVARAFGAFRNPEALAIGKDGLPKKTLYEVHFREIRIHGAYGRGTAFRRALALLPRLGVKRLVGGRFPLTRIEEAFAHATAGRGAKTMIIPGAA